MGISFPVLNLRRCINRPELLDPERSAVALDTAHPPTLLVYRDPLANLLLRCESARTYDLVSHWKVITREQCMPVVEAVFARTPFMLHGQAHAASRRALMPCYRKIGDSLENWLPDASRAFFASRQRGSSQPPLPFCREFLDHVFAHMLARELCVEVDAVLACGLPSQTLFALLPRAEEACGYEARLAGLRAFVERCLRDRGQDSEQVWGLLSVIVMGREPLLGALVYGLLHASEEGAWTAEALLRESAPVSLLGRVMEDDVTLDGVPLQRGQCVHVAPFLVHRFSALKATPENERSIEFGAGRHVCAGRALAISIVAAFLRGLSEADDLDIERNGVRMLRDFVLAPKEA